MDAQIDTRWFQNQLADKRLSQRQLAKRLSLDPAAVSLMLRGKRKMSASEAAEIAAQLGVSADEVLMRAGSSPTLPPVRRAEPDQVAKDVQIVKVSGPRSGDYGQGSFSMASHVRSLGAMGVESGGTLKARDVATSAPELGRPSMFELPVPMSDGSTAKLLLPRVLKRDDAERISALVQALALP
jgi:transcriptional regulator with XRE-family HTH domain